MGERKIVVASHLGKTVGWGRSLKWADWVHVTTFVSRWLDSGFGGARKEMNFLSNFWKRSILCCFSLVDLKATRDGLLSCKIQTEGMIALVGKKANLGSVPISQVQMLFKDRMSTPMYILCRIIAWLQLQYQTCYMTNTMITITR